MKKVFIVGGSGKIARRLARQLSTRGHTPVSLHRHAEQAEELKALGSTPVLGDLLALNANQLAQLMAGSDVVVFSAGAGGKGGLEMTNAIDGRGLELAVAAAQKAGVQRFLLVSAFPEASDRKSTRLKLQSLMRISYAVFCLKKKNNTQNT